MAKMETRPTSRAGKAPASKRSGVGGRKHTANVQDLRAMRFEAGVFDVLLSRGRYDETPSCVLRQTLRSGQEIRFDGNVIVLGDVNAGAQIVASGDIVVLGALRGLAHAGSAGNEAAIVAAFRLRPVQLRIGGRISRPPDGDDSAPALPEIATVRDGMVVIDQYHPLRVG